MKHFYLQPLSIAFVAISLIFSFGCGPELSNEELGTVIQDPKEVPGVETPYKLPDLSSHPEESPKPEKSDE